MPAMTVFGKWGGRCPGANIIHFTKPALSVASLRNTIRGVVRANKQNYYAGRVHDGKRKASI